MTTAGRSAQSETWIPAETFLALGYRPAGPEIDYSLRSGLEGRIRVSFSPFRDRDGGFIYAHDPATDSYRLLHADTTRDRAEIAWNMLSEITSNPDAYLGIGALIDGAPLSIELGYDLLRHCQERELAARADLRHCRATPYLQDAANAVTVAASARRCAEQLLLDAIWPEVEPSIIDYRFRELGGWSGRIIAVTPERACAEATSLADLARRNGFAMLIPDVAIEQDPSTRPERSTISAGPEL